MLILALSILPFKVQAVIVQPSSGTYNPGLGVTINVYASPNGSNQNAVAIRLGVTNMTVISFVPASGGNWIGSTPDCAGPAYYTSTTVCASLLKNATINNGEFLGTLIVQMGNAGAATITKTTGNAYSDGSTQIPDTGIAGSYTLAGAPVSFLPNTAIGGDFRELLFLFAGLILIITGLSLFNLKKKAYEKVL